MASTHPSVEVYQFKIALRGIRPPIWRRILIPNTMSLDELHETIQAAMGWFDYHLHEFELGMARYGNPEWDEFGDTLDESKVRLGDFMLEAGSRFLYTYDFGDDWQHVIELEAVLPYQADMVYPVCVKAKRSRPPEDVGGIWGYAEFLEAIRDKNHDEHDSMLEWVGGEFDPEAADIEGINRMLEKTFQGLRWSARKLKQ